MMNNFNTFFIIEMALLLLAFVIGFVFLSVVRTADKERLIRLMSGTKDKSLEDIKEGLVKLIQTISNSKVELFISIAIAILALLGLWYLNAIYTMPFLLSDNDFLSLTVGIAAIPLFYLYIEYFYKQILQKIEETINQKE